MRQILIVELVAADAGDAAPKLEAAGFEVLLRGSRPEDDRHLLAVAGDFETGELARTAAFEAIGGRAERLDAFELD